MHPWDKTSATCSLASQPGYAIITMLHQPSASWMSSTNTYYKAMQHSAVGVSDGIHNNHAISQQHNCLTTWVVEKVPLSQSIS